MKRWTTTMVLGAILASAIVVACSGDDDAESLCPQSCDKALECHPEFKMLLAGCKDNCKRQASMNKCSNEAAQIAKFKECLPLACAQFDACSEQVPQCVSTGSPGTGGVTGAGGSLGAGGASGGAGGAPAADCSTCVKADACCVALQSTQGQTQQPCTLAASCTTSGLTAENRALIVQSCSSILMIGSSANVAACK